MKMSHLLKQTFQPSIKFTSSLTFYSLQTLCRLLVGKESVVLCSTRSRTWFDFRFTMCFAVGFQISGFQ